MNNEAAFELKLCNIGFNGLMSDNFNIKSHATSSLFLNFDFKYLSWENAVDVYKRQDLKCSQTKEIHK